ncbi:hypothetical protein ACFWGN_17180 [Oerskovia sp. NPDC060338]|uniref:hypothetical protein n=1 Tax=Oerskovia sp. NPDC060338 TaxID=3347100 RepID=UPI0036586438
MTTPKPAVPPIPKKVPAAVPAGKASGGLILWGVVALVLGQVLYAAGQQSQLNAALSPYSTDTGSGPLIFIGAAISIVGLVLVVRAVLRLAERIDFLYHRNGGR